MNADFALVRAEMPFAATRDDCLLRARPITRGSAGQARTVLCLRLHVHPDRCIVIRSSRLPSPFIHRRLDLVESMKTFKRVTLAGLVCAGLVFGGAPAGALEANGIPASSVVVTEPHRAHGKSPAVTSEDVRLAQQYTSVVDGETVFDFEGAVDEGVNVKFAQDYHSFIADIQNTYADAESRTYNLVYSGGAARIVTHQDSSASKSGGARTTDALSCVVSATGFSLATVSLAAAVVASGGLFALALAGYSVSFIATFRDCYDYA